MLVMCGQCLESGTVKSLPFDRKGWVVEDIDLKGFVSNRRQCGCDVGSFALGNGSP